MLKTNMMYRPFHLEHNYKGMQEEKILKNLYAYQKGTLEVIISKLINCAVIEHMSLNIDSTIMQMHALTEYLVKLFTTNMENLVFNYCIHYLEANNIEEVDEQKAIEIEKMVKRASRKTDLESLGQKLEEIMEPVR